MKLLKRPYYLAKANFVYVVLLSFFFTESKAQENYPFSTDSTHLTIWNGTEYIPFFAKGINLGVSVPGTLPGELAATGEDYAKWFKQIKEAGFNCIRLYTLHYPRFYQVLDSFNRANHQNPLFFFQGVWLNEKYPTPKLDLFNLLDTFKLEIEENVDCVHGNRIIPERYGKSSGNFNVDASQWCVGFILGREVSPFEIVKTNESNANLNYYTGNHFSIDSASASETWFTSILDHTVHYEHTNYKTQRPVSASSWPTLDPIYHPEETNREEDSASIDLTKISIDDAPAGLFISYHAYPYYPDFISKQSSYLKYFDNYGPNSYLGYLKELKSHYSQLPLIIAEFGVPSSWAIAHYATSGMNHGGFDEYNQGLTNIRMLNTIKDANCGGGVQFEWIDEWFKRTWMTDPVDGRENRFLWHNVAAAEQNFGLVTYNETLKSDTLIQLDPSIDDLSHINAEINYAFFEMEVGLNEPLSIPDEMWVTFDTYGDSLGELLLPTSDTIPFRSEFALHITNYSANLYVTEAYDIFAIWHQIADSSQLYQSIPTEGAPWKIIRVKNNYFYSDVQYIGDLQVNFSFQNPSSKDAVTIYEDKIKIKIPWSYLNVIAPNKMRVLHDNKFTSHREDTVSEGVNVAVLYNDKWYYPDERFSWDTWSSVKDISVNERLKTSYYVMKNNLGSFNTPAIAVRDSFYFENIAFPVDVLAENGILANDFDVDGEEMISLLTENTKNGQVYLNNDGSFTYNPNPGFSGYDVFEYSVYDGNTLSKSNSVVMYVEQTTSTEEITFAGSEILKVYPNPTHDYLHLESQYEIDFIQVFDLTGTMIESEAVEDDSYTLDVTTYSFGNYIIVVKTGGEVVSHRFVKN